MGRPASVLWACSECADVIVLQGCFDMLCLWNSYRAAVHHKADEENFWHVFN